MNNRKEYDNMYFLYMVGAIIVLLVNTYIHAYGILYNAGLTWTAVDYIVYPFQEDIIFGNEYIMKSIAMLCMALCFIVRSGKGQKMDTSMIIGVGIISLVIFYFPFPNDLVYIICTFAGAAGASWTFAMIGRSFTGFHEHDNDIDESFEQEKKPVKGEYTLIFKTKYYFQKKFHRGYISVENPFRGTLIVGNAGSGKSYSVFNPYIEQMIAKGFTMMVYDFKMPDLTNVVYNALLRNKDAYEKAPDFYCINFKEPLKSNRCNPIAAEYLTDLIDASETARVVMEALNKGNDKKDFFWQSAQQYIGICLWYLRCYIPPDGVQGKWCDFPHLIELINQDYAKVLSIARKDQTLEGKVRMFTDAMDAHAQDQLQGQIASARIPLNDIASPALYWVLSGNDMNLDINDPEEPKILCIGNDPDRQQVYGAALSLFTFRVIKRVNRKNRVPCGIIMDELPTISIQGLDGLMATARSNRVAVALGVQDISQITAEYGEKTAEKIIALPGNLFIGACSDKTAEKYSKLFGREFRRQESQTNDYSNESVTVSFREEDIMPVKKIVSLKQGTFVGKVAVDMESEIKQPFFCGSIQISKRQERRKKRHQKEIPDLSDFGLDGLWDKIQDPQRAEIYLQEHFTSQVRKEWKKKSYTAEELHIEVAERINALSRRKKEKTLRSIMPKIREREIQRIINDNFITIKEDIKELIEREYKPPQEAIQEFSIEGDIPDDTGIPNDFEETNYSEGTDIRQLNISRRLYNALMAAQISTLEEITSMTRKEVQEIPSIGGVCFNELESELHAKGMKFADEEIQ